MFQAKKFFISIICANSLLLQTSCLTVGEEFSSQVTWIQKDKTSKSEIEQKFGAPFRVGFDSGLQTFTYAFYRYSIFRPTRTKDLVVRFHANKLVESYTFASSFDEDKAQIKP
jgi:hypothetical protein